MRREWPVEQHKERKVIVVPEIADSAIQTATTGSRCFTAVVSSIVAALIVMGIGGPSLTHGTLAWKFLGLFVLAIASAVLVAIVPGVNTFTKPSIKMILLALAAVAVMHLIRWHLKPDLNWIDEIKSYSIIGKIVSVVIMCIISPILEEIYFRGLLFPVLSIPLGSALGATLSAAFFILVHMSLGITIATILYTWLAYRYRSVYPSIVAHVAFNSVLFVRVVTWQQ